MYTVYKVINTDTQEYYIGVHKTDDPNDGYYGSGLRIKRAIRKYGKKTFVKEILFIYDTKEEAFQKEVDLLKHHINEDLCLNLSEGGQGGSNFQGKTHSEETRAKLSDVSVVRHENFSDEMKSQISKKISESNRKRKISDAARKNMSDAATRRHARRRQNDL